jgi:hypothetical protein
MALAHLNGVTDALLAAQNLCVEAEAHGLGICYLGTTIYTAEEIARILDLPKGVIPVTTIVVGHPDESPELTDRLPLDAVVHCEKYLVGDRRTLGREGDVGRDPAAARGERPAESGTDFHAQQVSCRR